MPPEMFDEMPPPARMRGMAALMDRALLRSVRIVAPPRIVDTEVTWHGGFRGRHYIEAPAWDGHESEDL
jgi:hypothetical protein